MFNLPLKWDILGESRDIYGTRRENPGTVPDYPGINGGSGHGTKPVFMGFFEVRPGISFPEIRTPILQRTGVR
jgi:hypothetical protein